MSIAEKLTYSTVLIKCKYANGSSGSGTGFIINLCQDNVKGVCYPVIITNNHVIDGSIETSFEFCLADEEGNPVDSKAFSVIHGAGIWKKHPDSTVDLCCMPLGHIVNHLKAKNVNIFYIPLTPDLIPSMEEKETFSAMEDVVMVGYPIGLSDEYNHKPIIRKGITATHIKKEYQGKKEFLVDMACFPGSSGSPIFILNEGSYHIGADLYAGNRIKFIGILYGGPQYAATGDLILMDLPNVPFPITRIPTNLGVAIKAERIFDFESMFASQVIREIEEIEKRENNGSR